MLKTEPYATFSFTTVDSGTTEQSPVEFFNGCKELLNIPKWWSVTVVFTMESKTVISEHTLVFTPTEKTLMKDFNPCINYILENLCLLPGFKFVKGKASCTIKNHKPVIPDVKEEINYELALCKAFNYLPEDTTQ